jgi:glycosyltransferase involved in cell wall biosynthesis
MRILIGLTYYHPHYSGLSIYTVRLARGLARLGHDVTVLTSRFSPELPAEEILDDVRVIRPAVMMRLSKGVIMPALPFQAARRLRVADVVNLHLPQMDAAYISWMARAAGKPVVMTYHCDLKLPAGIIHRIANQGAHLASHMTALASNAIVTNTRDYAEHSAFLRRYMAKMHFIPTPVEIPPVTPEQVQAFQRKVGIRPGERIIGMNARLASEKGVEYLIQALPEVLRRHPNARVLHAGQYQNVLGEEAYARKLAPMILQLGEHWKFLGVLTPEDQAAFFHSCEVLALPSLNSTESFGMVQVEAMTCGTPAIASDLPGVRIAVRESGMGRIVPLRNPAALADAISAILDDPNKYHGDSSAIRQRYSSETVARQYEALFQELIAAK